MIRGRGITNLIIELIALATLITVASLIFTFINNSMEKFKANVENIDLKIKALCIVYPKEIYVVIYNADDIAHVVDGIYDINGSKLSDTIMLKEKEIVVKQLNITMNEMPIVIHVEGEVLILSNCIDVRDMISQG